MDSLQGLGEKEIASSIKKNLCGIARVPISCLTFLDHVQHRALSPKNVTRLQHIFELEDCLRFDSENFIPVVIDTSTLDSILSASHVTAQQLRHYDSDQLPHQLKVPENFQLQCLQGQHRIEAARAYLDENDQWWTVEIYLSDLVPHAQRHIQEAYSNAEAFSDGEIFRKIRYYQKKGQTQAEDKWWARLTPSKTRDLNQFLKNAHYAAQFDKLLEMPGFWAPVQLGILHRLLPLRIEEEIVHYLEHIVSTWSTILGPSIPCSAVDSQTVTRLELLAPASSAIDRQLVVQQMHSHQLFSSILDHKSRSSLLRRILRIRYMIPSLRVLFENTIYLEPCCIAMKKLIGRMTRPSIRQCFYDSFQQPTQQVMENSEGHFVVLNSADKKHSQISGYRQLWLYAMRHLSELVSAECPQALPKKNQKKAKPPILEPSPLTWSKFAELALRLGFQLRGARELNNQKPSQIMALRFLRQAMPGAGLDLQRPLWKEKVSQISQILSEIPREEMQTDSIPQWTSPISSLTIDQRCGRPYHNNHRLDVSFLFLQHMQYSETLPDGEHITSIFVRRDFFHSFLGKFKALDIGETIGPGGNDFGPMSETNPVTMPESQQQNEHEDLMSKTNLSDDNSSDLQVIQTLQHDIKAKDAFIRKKECEIQDSTKKYNMSQTHLARSQAELFEMSQQQKTLSEVVAQLRAVERNPHTLVSDNLSKISELEDSIEQNKKVISDLQHTVASNDVRLEHFQTVAENAKLDKNQTLEQYEQKIQAYQQTSEAQTKNIVQVKARLQAAIIKKTREMSDLKKQTEKEVAEYQHHIQTLTAQTNDTHQEMAGLQDALNKERQEMNALREKTEKEVAEYQHHIQTIIAQTNDTDQEMAGLRDALNKERQEMSALKEKAEKEVADYQHYIQSLQQQANHIIETRELKFQLATQETKVREVMQESQISSLRTQLNYLQFFEVNFTSALTFSQNPGIKVWHCDSNGQRHLLAFVCSDDYQKCQTAISRYKLIALDARGNRMAFESTSLLAYSQSGMRALYVVEDQDLAVFKRIWNKNWLQWENEDQKRVAQNPGDQRDAMAIEQNLAGWRGFSAIEQTLEDQSRVEEIDQNREDPTTVAAFDAADLDSPASPDPSAESTHLQDLPVSPMLTTGTHFDDYNLVQPTSPSRMNAEITADSDGFHLSIDHQFDFEGNNSSHIFSHQAVLPSSLNQSRQTVSSKKQHRAQNPRARLPTWEGVIIPEVLPEPREPVSLGDKRAGPIDLETEKIRKLPMTDPPFQKRRRLEKMKVKHQRHRDPIDSSVKIDGHVSRIEEVEN